MEILNMLEEMRKEHRCIVETITVLERLSLGQGRRIGRPPAWMKATKFGAKRRGRPPGSKNKPMTECPPRSTYELQLQSAVE
jgi:hypothetical protein